MYELELFARFIWCLLWTLFSQLQLLIMPTILIQSCAYPVVGLWKLLVLPFEFGEILSKSGIILQSAFELLMHCRAKMLIMRAFRNNGLVVHMAAWLLNLAYAILVTHWAVGPTRIKTLWSSGDCDSLCSVNNYGVLVGIQHLTWVVVLWLWRCYTRLCHVGYNRHQA